MDITKEYRDTDGVLNWGRGGGEGGQETEEQEQNRLHAQKYFGLWNNPEFIAKVHNSISPEKQRPEAIVNIFQKLLGAETFQHNIDVSVSVRLALKQLISDELIYCFDRNNQLVQSVARKSSSCNNEVEEDTFYDLIVENNGWVSTEK